jgi:predicted lipase
MISYSVSYCNNAIKYCIQKRFMTWWWRFSYYHYYINMYRHSNRMDIVKYISLAGMLG